MSLLAEVVDVVDVVQASALPQLDACHLDEPLVGPQSVPGGLPVSGWALSRGSAIVAVEIDHEGATVARATSLEDRPDVAAVFPGHPGAERAGFRLTVAGVWGEPIKLQVLAVLSDRSRCEVGTITVRALSDRENAPLVSVVIPCYGQAHFLSDAVASVLSQTHPNVEVIVVDDGSHDNVAAVVAKYPGVRYVRQNNRGLPAARNTGIRESSGEFLVFLDADDMLLPLALQAGLDRFERHPESGLVIGHMRFVDRDGNQLPWTEKQPYKSEDHYRMLLRGIYIGPPAICVFARRVLDEVGGFDETLLGAADFEMILRVARCFPAEVHDTVVVQYRRGPHNMSSDPELMFNDVTRVARRQRRYAFATKNLREAYAEGRERFREWYRSDTLALVDAAVAAHDWRRAWLGIATLIRCDPRSLLKLVRHRRTTDDHRPATTTK